MNFIKKSLNLFQNEKWTYLMGWRYVSYFEKDQWISFEIEPMYQSACLIKIPDENSWKKSSPLWARANREEILNNLKSIPWNRPVAWKEESNVPFLKLPKGKGFQGNLECSPEGRRLEGLRIFHPKASKHFAQEVAKQKWYRLVQAYVMSRQGDYYIPLNNSSSNSVTKEVEWPAARANHNITINTY